MEQQLINKKVYLLMKSRVSALRDEIDFLVGMMEVLDTEKFYKDDILDRIK